MNYKNSYLKPSDWQLINNIVYLSWKTTYYRENFCSFIVLLGILSFTWNFYLQKKQSKLDTVKDVKFLMAWNSYARGFFYLKFTTGVPCQVALILWRRTVILQAYFRPFLFTRQVSLPSFLSRSKSFFLRAKLRASFDGSLFKFPFTDFCLHF